MVCAVKFFCEFSIFLSYLNSAARNASETDRKSNIFEKEVEKQAILLYIY